MHTNRAAESIERLLGIQPPERQVQFQLSICISVVVYQSLMPMAGDKARIAVFEVLVGTMSIKNLIRTNQITSRSGPTCS